MTQGDRAIYLYGLTSGSHDAPIEVSGVGPGEAPVRRIRAAGLTAVVSDVSRAPLVAARDLRAHWRVLEAIGAHATVLPVRFGTVLDSEDAVRDDVLARGAERLRRRLDELDGKVQLSVKGFYDEERLMRDIVKRSRDVARLRERTRNVPDAATYYDRIRLGELVAAELERARADDTELVVSRLEPLAVSATAESPKTRDGAVNAAFLVERDRVDAFTTGVQQLVDEVSDRMRIRYVGPLPPYSFAGEEMLGTETWA